MQKGALCHLPALPRSTKWLCISTEGCKSSISAVPCTTISLESKETLHSLHLKLKRWNKAKLDFLIFFSSPFPALSRDKQKILAGTGGMKPQSGHAAPHPLLLCYIDATRKSLPSWTSNLNRGSKTSWASWLNWNPLSPSEVKAGIETHQWNP